MSPIVRTAGGLAAALGLLVVLASCGGIEVLSGAQNLNGARNYCRYIITPNKSANGAVELWPVWTQTDFPTQPAIEYVKAVCVPTECTPGASSGCRVPTTPKTPIKTPISTEDYALTMVPCAYNCAGHLASW